MKFRVGLQLFFVFVLVFFLSPRFLAGIALEYVIFWLFLRLKSKKEKRAARVYD